MNSILWNDVARKGAILGVLMLASHILEQALMFNGSLSRVMAAGFEMLVVAVVYVWLIYRFTKRFSLRFSAEEGFSYSLGLAYVVSMSLLAGIIVGLGGYVYTHFIVGYESYIEGVVNMYSSILASASIPASMAGMYETMLDQIEAQPEPGIFTTLFSSVWSYMFTGLMIVVVAGIVKRNPRLFDEVDE